MSLIGSDAAKLATQEAINLLNERLVDVSKIKTIGSFTSSADAKAAITDWINDLVSKHKQYDICIIDCNYKNDENMGLLYGGGYILSIYAPTTEHAGIFAMSYWDNKRLLYSSIEEGVWKSTFVPLVSYNTDDDFIPSIGTFKTAAEAKTAIETWATGLIKSNDVNKIYKCHISTNFDTSDELGDLHNGQWILICWPRVFGSDTATYCGIIGFSYWHDIGLVWSAIEGTGVLEQPFRKFLISSDSNRFNLMEYYDSSSNLLNVEKSEAVAFVYNHTVYMNLKLDFNASSSSLVSGGHRDILFSNIHQNMRPARKMVVSAGCFEASQSGYAIPVPVYIQITNNTGVITLITDPSFKADNNYAYISSHSLTFSYNLL